MSFRLGFVGYLVEADVQVSWEWKDRDERGREGDWIAISGESTDSHSCTRLDYQANPLCWMMLEALRGLFQVLHRSLDLLMLLPSDTVTVEALKVRRLETESSLPCYQKGHSRSSLWASVSLPVKGK